MQRGKAGAEKHAAQQKAEQERKEERLRPLRKVANCITSRGYRMTRPQFGFQTNTRVLLPWVEVEEGGGKDVMHFPLMLYYPEKLPYHDTVEDACELDTISAHLDMVRYLTPLPTLVVTGQCSFSVFLKQRFPGIS